MHLRPLFTVLRQTGRSRLTALRLARPSLRLAITASAIDVGVLEALAREREADDLADELGMADRELFRAYLDLLTAQGLLRRRDGRYRRTRLGSATLADRVTRATYQAFGGFHTGLYRELPIQLHGGPGRDDVTARADVIAGLSEFMAPFVHNELGRVVDAAGAERVLDVGCGTGHHLATMLTSAPGATGVGVELDPATAELAAAELAGRFGDRVEVRVGDVREQLAPEERFDLVLAANFIYYLPLQQRPAFLADLAGRLRPGGRLLILTTALNDELFSRHFDLLLRAQHGDMGLPDLDVLRTQLEGAGLRPAPPKRLTPAEPLYLVEAER